MLQESGWGGECGGDSFDGWECLWVLIALGCEVLQREEGAETDGEWGGLADEGLAESGDGRVGHDDRFMKEKEKKEE